MNRNWDPISHGNEELEEVRCFQELLLLAPRLHSDSASVPLAPVLLSWPNPPALLPDTLGLDGWLTPLPSAPCILIPLSTAPA